MPMTVVLPDGKEVEAVRGVTTPMDIAVGISKGLAKKCIVATVDGKSWDLKRPMGVDGQGERVELKLCTFDDAEGKETFWHSTSHILGELLELEYGVDLTIGPPIEEGFYYDCYMGERTLNEADLPNIKSKVRACARAPLCMRARGERATGGGGGEGARQVRLRGDDSYLVRVTQRHMEPAAESKISDLVLKTHARARARFAHVVCATARGRGGKLTRAAVCPPPSPLGCRSDGGRR